MWLGQYGRKLDLKHFQMLEAHITYALRVAVVTHHMITKSNDAFFLMMYRTRACSQRLSLYFTLERHTFLRVFTMHAHQSQAQLPVQVYEEKSF